MIEGELGVDMPYAIILMHNARQNIIKRAIITHRSPIIKTVRGRIFSHFVI